MNARRSLHSPCRRIDVGQSEQQHKRQQPHTIAFPVTHADCVTTVIATIIRAVSIGLHPASNANISTIMLSCDRDNAALGRQRRSIPVSGSPLQKACLELVDE